MSVAVSLLALGTRGAQGATLHLVDSTFDAPPTARLFLVDQTTGELTLEADLDASYAPYLGLAALDATRFYTTGTDATCGPGLQGCVLLEIVLSPPSSVPTIIHIGTVTDAATGLTLVGMVGMTFRSNGLLYAVSEDTDSLYVLDPQTAEATLVGSTGIDLHGGDVTFDASGRLWDWTNSGSASGLYRLDPGSAEASLMDSQPDLSFTGLTALGHSNLMFGSSPGNNSLYTVDPESGLTGDILPFVWGGTPYDLSRGDLDSPYCESDAVCLDADPCTVDSCTPAGCEHKPVAECCDADEDCDDANPCTDDACGPGAVCKHPDHAGACDDGDPCTTGDACFEGTCLGGPAPSCDDANPCTNDTCVSPTGCVHQPIDGGGTSSCGTGACYRTVPNCAAGTPQTCVPGTPAQGDATCDGSDDDCDNQTDEDFAPQTTSCGQGLCAAEGSTSCVSGSLQDSCAPGSPSLETCDGMDNDCDGSVDQGLGDADADGVCDGRDNCALDANAGQEDLDGDGAGDACDFGIAVPASGAVLDCADTAARPVISWIAGAYDRYRVEISWVADFSSKVTSGDTLLSARSWTPGRNKWRRVCEHAGGSVHIRVFGVDRNRPRKDPARKTYTPAVTTGVQH